MSNYSAESLFRVDGLVAVITGGGSGLGRIMAHSLAANGAKAVYILGRRESSLNETRDSSTNPEVIKGIVCDVTSKDALKAAADRVRGEVGYCDVLFANSGVITTDDAAVMDQAGKTDIKTLQEGMWKHDMEKFTECLHVNITAAFYTVVAFLELLDEGNKRGVVPQKSQVVITTSTAAYLRLPKSGFAYGCSKAGAAQLGAQLSSFLAPYKIRVNSIAPGMYPSEMTKSATDALKTDPRVEGSLPNNFIPLERIGNEEDFAGVVLYVASKAGSYVDGSVLLTDGGRLSIVPGTY